MTASLMLCFLLSRNVCVHLRANRSKNRLAILTLWHFSVAPSVWNSLPSDVPLRRSVADVQTTSKSSSLRTPVSLVLRSAVQIFRYYYYRSFFQKHAKINFENRQDSVEAKQVWTENGIDAPFCQSAYSLLDKIARNINLRFGSPTFGDRQKTIILQISTLNTHVSLFHYSWGIFIVEGFPLQRPDWRVIYCNGLILRILST